MMLLPVLLATVGPRCYASAETTSGESTEFGGGGRSSDDGGEGGSLDDDGDHAGTIVNHQPEMSVVDYQLEDR